MAKIIFTRALKRFYPDLEPMEVSVKTVAEVVEAIEKNHPGLAGYIINEHGNLRKHVNIFVDNKLILDKKHLADKIEDGNEVYIMQALSGG